MLLEADHGINRLILRVKICEIRLKLRQIPEFGDLGEHEIPRTVISS